MTDNVCFTTNNTNNSNNSNSKKSIETDWMGKCDPQSYNLLPHITHTLFPERDVRSASRIDFKRDKDSKGENNPYELLSDYSPDLKQFLISAPVSTMVIIYRLLGNIKVNAFFPLLHITHVEDPNPQAKNAKTPFYPHPGHILSARYSEDGKSDMYRGFSPRPKKKAFLNCITIDISTVIKNVSLKISKSTIQECGAVSIENGVEAIWHLIQHVHHIDKYLRYIQQNMTAANEVIEWLEYSCCGDSYTDQFGNKFTVLIYPKCYYNKDWPEKLDKKILFWFLSFMNCYVTYDSFMKIIRWIPTQTCIVDGADFLLMDYCTKEMVNHKYSVGRILNKKRLVEVFYKQPGFYVDYDNEIDSQVSIQVPYGLKKVGNKKISCITFLVCKTGTITQTGPNELYNYLSCVIFGKILMENLNYIAIN